jgi:BAI1-associated protein 3
MYITAQRAFGVSPDRHYRLLHAAVEEKPKIIVLSVIVQEAEGLEAKDANGEHVSFTLNTNLGSLLLA